MKEITLQTPAKLNLSLQVSSGVFPSPFAKNELRHKLESRMMKIPLFDTLQFKKIEKKKIQMAFTGPEARGVPNNSENLIFRAAEVFFQKTGFSSGVEIHGEKNIPSHSGLGGGSSDAAATLRALQKLFPEKAEKISQEEWNNFAMSLGSDVPFFFQDSSTAHVSGFGEICTPLPESTPGKYLTVAMLPKIFCDTSWAYRQLDSIRTIDPIIFKNAQNDFEIPIFFHFPDLQKLRDDFLKFGAVNSGLTGSGSAIFAFFETREDQERAKEKLSLKCSFWKDFDLEKEIVPV